MMRLKIVPWIGLVLLLLAPARLMAGEQVVTVEVQGLSCPFCAFGLEKKLRRLEGVQSVTLKVDDGEAVIAFAPDATIDEEKIRLAVVEGGFTPGKITISKAD